MTITNTMAETKDMEMSSIMIIEVDVGMECTKMIIIMVEMETMEEGEDPRPPMMMIIIITITMIIMGIPIFPRRSVGNIVLDFGPSCPSLHGAHYIFLLNHSSSYVPYDPHHILSTFVSHCTNKQKTNKTDLEINTTYTSKITIPKA